MRRRGWFRWCCGKRESEGGEETAGVGVFCGDGECTGFVLRENRVKLTQNKTGEVT